MTDATTPGGLVPDPEGVPSDAAGNQDQLLDRLLYAGVLPRYAFPTDVTKFHVFDTIESTPFRTKYVYSPQQGMVTALSQYAPGKEVVIDGKKFYCGALYASFRKDLSEAWAKKRWYYECANCGFAETKPISEGVRNEVLNCEACGQAASLGPARHWMRPPGFAHPWDQEPGTTPDDGPLPSRPTKAKLLAPSPSDDDPGWRRAAEGVRVKYIRGRLLVSNTGPDGAGYSYCTSCGRIEPAIVRTSVVFGAHKKPYPDSRHPECEAPRVAREVCLGTDFFTDILLVQLSVTDPVRLLPGLLATQASLRTVCDAVARAACRYLELEDGEIAAEFRPALSVDGQQGRTAEIYLYDTLPGGGGFCREVAGCAKEVLEMAQAMLEECDCDASCYKCLRSFGNRFDHVLLDRAYGSGLLRQVLTGVVPSLPVPRTFRALSVLAEDVSRQGTGRVSVEMPGRLRDAALGEVEVPLLVRGPAGRCCGVAVTHPLAPDHYPEAALAEWAEFGAVVPVRGISELLIARSLPGTTQALLAAVGAGSGAGQ